MAAEPYFDALVLTMGQRDGSLIKNNRLLPASAS